MSNRIHPRRTTLALGLLAVLTLGACNAGALARQTDPAPTAAEPSADVAGAGGSPSAGTGAPEDPVVGTPAPPVPAPGDGATDVKPQKGVKDAIPHAIDHISVASDGRSLTVYWWGGVDACYALKEVQVDQRPDGTLVITVLEGRRGDVAKDTACIEIALLKATTVTLDEPIYVDGSAA
jgi:hypothetical protein